MHPLLDQLDNDHKAFIVGTAFHIQYYETADGIRFKRQRDGSYSSGEVAYPSLAHLLDETSGPITPGQLYALVAVYHPLVTARVNSDQERPQMSRAEARRFILEDFPEITPFDLSLEAGSLHFGRKEEGRKPKYVAPRQDSPPPPPPAPTPAPRRKYTALVEVTYVADGDVDTGVVEDEIRRALPQLLQPKGEGKIEATQVGLAGLSESEPA